MLFDSHCHLTCNALAAELEGVLTRAAAARVTRCLNIGDNIDSSRQAIAQGHQNAVHGIELWATVGIHPQHALEYNEATRGQLENLARRVLRG